MAVVGEGQSLTIYEDDATAPYIALIEGEERSRGAKRDPAPEGAAEDQPAGADPGAADPPADQPETMDQS